MKPNARCSSRDPNIKNYFKITCLGFKCDRDEWRHLSRFWIEGAGALPLWESVANGKEHLRLWRTDPSGDIREPGSSFTASLLLAKERDVRRAGGIRTGSQRHSRRLGLLGRVSDPLLSATCDLSEPYRY